MTFLRYLFVQLLAYAVDMGFFLFFVTWVGIGPIYANIISKISAGFFAFIVQRRFTFKLAGNDLISKQAIRYFIVLIINIPIASAILSLILFLISDNVQAKVYSDIVGVGVSYLLSKYFIFSEKFNLTQKLELKSKK